MGGGGCPALLTKGILGVNNVFNSSYNYRKVYTEANTLHRILGISEYIARPMQHFAEFFRPHVFKHKESEYININNNIDNNCG